MNRNQNFNQKRHKSKNLNKKLNLPSKNKVYDSTGPFGSKVRGTAQQVYDKYASLAKDAYTSGDRINYESYSQHAEHYYRELQMINSAHAEAQRLQAEAQAAAAAQKQAEAEARSKEKTEPIEAIEDATPSKEQTEPSLIVVEEKAEKPKNKKKTKKEVFKSPESIEITEDLFPEEEKKKLKRGRKKIEPSIDLTGKNLVQEEAQTDDA